MAAQFSRYHFYFFSAILAICAMAALHISTPAGAGLANDSVAYIAGARSILQGTGYSDIWLDSDLEPVTHYPPLLSLALSTIGLFGIDPLRGARLLNILLFGVNTLLMALIGWRMSGSRAAGLWLAALFLLNAALLRVHVFALSEPLFLCLSLLSFLFIDFYLANVRPIPGPGAPALAVVPRKNSAWVLLAGVSCGLAFLTRYSALALLPTFVLALILFHQTWRSRLAAAGLFLAGAVPIMAAWFLRNNLAAGNVTNRTFQYHPVMAENIQPGFYNLSQFLMPIEPWRQALYKSGLVEWIAAILGVALLFWLAAQTFRIIFRPAGGLPRPLTFTTVIYVFGYIGAVLFSMSFFDASTKFQPRILAPLYVSFLLLGVAVAVSLWRKKQIFLRGLVIILVAASLSLSVYDYSRSVAEFKSAGQGYASWKWHDSLIMAALRELPSGTVIYTNTPPAVYLVTGRASRILPTPVDPVDNLARSDYEQNAARMRADLMAGKAVLALFDTSSQEDTSGPQDTADFTAGLKVLQKAQGDILYGKP